MKLGVTSILIAILAASCTPNPQESQDQKPVISIASELPTSGTAFADVIPLRSAISLAIQERGSIHGYRLIHEPFDYSLAGNNGEPFKAEQNVRIMSRRSQILAVIGPFNSMTAQFEIPRFNEAGLVMISPSNTMDCLTSVAPPCPSRQLTNNYFRIGATDSAQARVGAQFAIRKLSLKRFAVLTDGSPYSRVMTEQFTAALNANGGTAAFRATYSQNSNDYTPLLREARAAGAEAVFVAGFGFFGACRVRAGMSGVFPADAYMLASDYVVDTACAPDAGSGANDHFLAIVSDSQPAQTSKIYKAFQARGIRPTTYAFSAYDCAQIVIDAIDRAIQANGGKLPTRRNVLDAVAATHDFAGATGTFTFQSNGDAVNPAVSVYRLEKGHWTFWQNAS